MLVTDVFITEQLARRAPSNPDYLREKLALQDLARQMADHPEQVLPRLVALAMDACGAGSAGISILEPETQQFRWFGLTGVLATFEGTHTPRNHSPCGVCLDVNGPILMDSPERVYEWIREANISVPEVLLVPLCSTGSSAIGTLWIVADRKGHFDSGHARVLTELSAFAAIALRMIQAGEQLNQAFQQQEVLTREMSHRVKNLFALAAGMIRLSARGAQTKDELVEVLSGRLQALSDANALVRRQFGGEITDGVSFEELIRRILRPHGYAKSSVGGPDFSVGEKSTNSLALIFHELATNAAKYGAFSSERGLISVQWKIPDNDLHLTWNETDGPAVVAPRTQGFGSRLVASTIEGLGGSVDYEWLPAGLVAKLRLPLASLKA
jgi:two-component sensor histidine kinase